MEPALILLAVGLALAVVLFYASRPRRQHQPNDTGEAPDRPAAPASAAASQAPVDTAAAFAQLRAHREYVGSVPRAD